MAKGKCSQRVKNGRTFHVRTVYHPENKIRRKGHDGDMFEDAQLERFEQKEYQCKLNLQKLVQPGLWKQITIEGSG